jgi:2-amino-4-hydroxy-6-hydroxymethyldihydropteridine diphosphokinase
VTARSAAAVLQPAYIALGANLADPQAQVRAAFEELAMLPDTRLNAVSSLYRSAPVGHLDQPDFVNAIAAIETALTPRVLLDALLEIERRYGRVRDFPNAPRTLDLDIILYGAVHVNEPGLTIPHPRLNERAFVLVPLAEIAPDALVPGLGRVSDLAARADFASLTKIEQ